MATQTKRRSNAYMLNLNTVTNPFLINALLSAHAKAVYGLKKMNNMYTGLRAEDEHHIVHELFIEGVNKGISAPRSKVGYPDLLAMNKISGKYEIVKYGEGDTSKWEYLYGML